MKRGGSGVNDYLRKRVSGAFPVVLIMTLLLSIPACARLEKGEAPAKKKPVVNKDKLLEEVRKTYVCPESNAPIAESKDEGLPCSTGEKALELVAVMADAGWEEEKIRAYVTEVFVQGRDTSFVVPGDRQFRGNKDAPVAMVEFTDMQCPFCKRYFQQTFPALMKDYVETGKLKYVQINLPLPFHQQAQKAAEALYCANEAGRFWEMREKEFINQDNLSPEALQKYASELGIKPEAFKQCLDSGRYASKVQEDLSIANRAGVRGTPGFIVARTRGDGKVRGTYISGAVPTENFVAVIEETLKKVGKK
ncbi:MAG: thioredoxin domain-containing protein [bacterium]